MDISTIVDGGLTLLSTMGAASLLSALLPRPSSGPVLVVFKVIDFLAANWLNARNARQ